MELFLVLAFLGVFTGAIALLVLVGKVIVKLLKGRVPIDHDPQTDLRRSHPYAINAILVTLVLLGALSFAALYVIGSALAGLR